MTRYMEDSEIPVVLSEKSKQRRLDKAKRDGELFLKGPIPIRWLRKSIGLSGKAAGVGLYLWWQAGMQRTHNDIQLNCRGLDWFGIGKNSCSLGLSALEQAGLVTVERCSGKCPRVSIVKDGGKE